MAQAHCRNRGRCSAKPFEDRAAPGQARRSPVKRLNQLLNQTRREFEAGLLVEKKKGEGQKLSLHAALAIIKAEKLEKIPKRPLPGSRPTFRSGAYVPEKSEALMRSGTDYDISRYLWD